MQLFISTALPLFHLFILPIGLVQTTQQNQLVNVYLPLPPLNFELANNSHSPAVPVNAAAPPVHKEPSILPCLFARHYACHSMPGIAIDHQCWSWQSCTIPNLVHMVDEMPHDNVQNCTARCTTTRINNRLTALQISQVYNNDKKYFYKKSSEELLKAATKVTRAN